MNNNQYRKKIEELLQMFNSVEPSEFIDIESIRKKINLPSKDLLIILNFLEFIGLILKNRDKTGKIELRLLKNINPVEVFEILDSMKNEKIQIETKLVVSSPSIDKFGFQAFLKTNAVNYENLVDSFHNLFALAEKSIQIISPFIDYDGLKHFEKKLIQKSKQNVRIDIITREIHLNSYRYKKLLRFIRTVETSGDRKNLQFYEYYHKDENRLLLSSIHSKIIIVDNLYFYCGSGEIRKNSFTKNLEIGIMGTGKLVLDLSKIFEYFISISSLIKWGD